MSCTYHDTVGQFVVSLATIHSSAFKYVRVRTVYTIQSFTYIYIVLFVFRKHCGIQTRTFRLPFLLTWGCFSGRSRSMHFISLLDNCWIIVLAFSNFTLSVNMFLFSIRLCQPTVACMMDYGNRIFGRLLS